MTAPTARHETRALLRAHLSAAAGYRHRTEHCPVCRKLLRLAMEPEPDDRASRAPDSPCRSSAGRHASREEPQDESPADS
ncbi:DUF6274 family protein [Streptomyces candidus]|uniref:Uncharacterized protein n=1 Tax=Streptomyces candidus TaxID=67283 RepID=A0A7X0HGC8_9ACTN|nr:DUF6274 family protein [Streptomyces candidus]MBB6437136.1 hypothetical protein [Streptomyces candidus]GHH37947.1 hypothetical protein GCM10018773_15120 [Streptomyces candidus]